MIFFLNEILRQAQHLEQPLMTLENLQTMTISFFAKFYTSWNNSKIKLIQWWKIKASEGLQKHFELLLCLTKLITKFCCLITFFLLENMTLMFWFFKRFSQLHCTFCCLKIMQISPRGKLFPHFPQSFYINKSSLVIQTFILLNRY